MADDFSYESNQFPYTYVVGIKSFGSEICDKAGIPRIYTVMSPI